MTPEQIGLVQSSFERLGPDVPAMADRFYRELFQRDPTLRPLFTTDMAEQRVRFAQKLTAIVRAMPRLGELLVLTRALGARHVAYGVHAGHYRTVGDALIAAIAAALGAEFDAETREAWVLAYNIVAETMLEGAASARPIGGLSAPAAATRELCKGGLAGQLAAHEALADNGLFSGTGPGGVFERAAHTAAHRGAAARQP